MRRYLSHATILGLFALVASLALHGVGVVGLGEISVVEPPAPRRVRASRLEFIEMPPLEASDTPPVEPVDTTPDDREPPVVAEVAAPEPAENDVTAAVVVPVADEAEPVVVPPPPAPEPEPEVAPPEPPTQPDRNLLSVEQTSDDPSVPPPPDAQHLAAENRRVEEETQATETRLDSDSPDSAPPPESDSPIEATDDGADSSRTAESDESGDEREATAGEPERAPTEATETRPATTPRVGTQVEGRTESAMAGSRATGSGGSGGTPSEEMEAVTIDDGFGTFTVMRPRSSASGGTPGEARPRGEGGSSRERGGSGVSLRIGYSNFEATYGADTLAEERAARRAAREALAAASGSHRRERWDQFRFAAENFIPTVRPGNQTALNAAASPFAAWISAVHRRIHAHFAEEFLQRIARQTGPLANPQLYAELEIVIDVRGRVLRVGITHTSGLSAFDLGAFSSVIDAQPFPVPPDVILSGDGNVYTKWGFSRGPSACTSQQAAPFILPNPPPLVPMPGVTVDPDAAAAARRRHMPADLQADDIASEDLAPAPEPHVHSHDDGLHADPAPSPP